MNALNAFLDELSQTPDAFVVTLTDAIKWMQQPMPLNKIHKLDAWMCQKRSTIGCRSVGAMKLSLRSGQDGPGGWDTATVPVFGRFNRYMWMMELGLLSLAYVILRIRDRRQ